MPKVEKYIESPRVSTTDFVLGTNDEGEVKRFPGKYFITSLVNELQYLALWQDERDARISSDDLLGIRIDNVELAYGTRITDLENGLAGYKIEVNDMLYGPGGIEESYQSAIVQKADEINLSVQQELYGTGGIQESYRSEISVESDSIISTVNNTLYGPGGIEESYTSQITQLSNSIDLSIFQNGELQAGLLIEKINNDPSRIALTADVIQIDGTTSFSSNYDPSEKTRTFRGSVVIPPYDNNDEWFADDGNHYICINPKSSIESYDENDWILATRYVGSDEINDFVVAEIDPLIGDIQQQIDKQLVYYFNDSTNPVDTTVWGATEVYNKWYQPDTGNAYEWLSDGSGGYEWVAITDDAVIELLERASQAQDTADEKRRVFVVEPPATPTTPYDEGDLWVQGIDGDILTCVNTKATGDYVEGDFAKKNKYTDDTEALKKSTRYIYGTDPSLDWENAADHVADEWVVHAEFNETTSSWTFWTGYPTLPTELDGNYIKTNFVWDGTEWDIDDTQIDGGRIITNKVFAENIYASGAALGGFTINETTLQLGTQTTWNPTAGVSGLLMGEDTSDGLYKCFIGNETAYMLWDGTQLSLTGDVQTDSTFADNVYLSGATIGGFNITENYLNLGTQINWNPNSATEGLIMGLDTADSKYKFFVGNNTDHLIWNGSNLIISGFALIGDSSSTTTLNDLAQWNDIFEIVNPGQVNEYLKVKAPLASTGEIAAWSGDSEDFPPSIWDSMRIASSTYVGGVKLSSDFNIATDGTLSINGDIGSGFDETSNYSPSGIWNFTGTLNYGGNAVATQTWANGQFHPLGGSSTNNFETNDLVIHGTVNHWVSDVITVDDARLQLNRTQDAATVASGIDVYNGTSVVSSLLYNTAGRWQIGGQNIATESWVGLNYLGKTAKAADADKLDGLDSSQFLRSDVNDIATGLIQFFQPIEVGTTTGNYHKLSETRTDSANNQIYHREWAYRSTSGTSWTSMAIHDGLSVDTIYNIPRSNTRTWWERHLLENWQAWGTGTSEYMRLTGAGLGINTGTPLAPLHVISASTADQAKAQQWSYTETSSDNSGYHLKLKQTTTSGVVRWTFDQVNNSAAYDNVLTFDRGKIGINTTNPSEKLHVVGNGLFSGNITSGGNITASGEVTAYSDVRLKDIIQPTASVLDRINALTIYNYTRNDVDDKKLRTGLLAQDLQKQFPQFVSGKEGKDSYLSINYSEYAATVATKGIQELYAIIQELQQRIEELEKQ